MRIGIVGAGAAGLAAAYDLTRHGHQVVVYESAPFIGGQASTISVGGHPLERGYHHLFLNDTAILTLMEELGIADAMQWYPSNVGTYVDGDLHRTTSAFDLLRFKALPLLERIRLGLFTLRLKSLKRWENLEDSTADEWLKSHLGRKAYEALWNPLLRGKFGRYHDEIGMPWLWSKIQTRFASRRGLLAKEVLGYPTGSFDVLFDKLAAAIRNRNGEIRLSHRVTEITPLDSSGSVWVQSEHRWQPSREKFDCVLATVPSFEMLKLLNGLPKDYADRLSAARYLAAVVVILELKYQLTEFYWTNIADDKVSFLGMIEHTNMLPQEWYDNSHVLYLTNYLDRSDRLFQISEQELIDEHLSHLYRFNPNFRHSWVKNVHYNAVSAAQPIVGTNYSQMRPAHHTPFERIYLANTTQIYPEDRGTNYSIRMGRELAEMMMHDHRFRWSVWPSQ